MTGGVDSWVGVVGLVIALGGVAINVGFFLAKLKMHESRIRGLEEARGRMGEQLHKAMADVRVAAAIVEERSRTRTKTLARLRSGEAAVPAELSEEGAPSDEQSR